ncbi:putative Rho GDP-dissociation inhibitor [Hibiscus syriacus]|uniref:Rho GDP-dissociation inhibitor n=1 Tax=Hibiscus syriacus TaxID=106335 RepID=A0A6A2YUL4_HIBSY|nr:putative Rho GDP-dissociation inhibitor [Hibiscus syriacus]
MSSATFAAPLALYQRTRINSKPFQHRPSLHKIHGGITCIYSNFHSSYLKQSLVPVTYPSRKQRGLSTLVPPVAKGSGSGEEDSQGALETVLKLYSAIKNRNVHELSDIIDDECQCICNFFSCFRPLQGKKQVIEFFTSLIKYMGNHIEFVVQPTLNEGMVVGIHWRLEWNNANVPLGKGFSFYTCHVYHGKVMIRNVEMFMEPLLHLEPFRLVSDLQVFFDI